MLSSRFESNSGCLRLLRRGVDVDFIEESVCLSVCLSQSRLPGVATDGWMDGWLAFPLTPARSLGAQPGESNTLVLASMPCLPAPDASKATRHVARAPTSTSMERNESNTEPSSELDRYDSSPHVEQCRDPLPTVRGLSTRSPLPVGNVVLKSCRVPQCPASASLTKSNCRRLHPVGLLALAHTDSDLSRNNKLSSLTHAQSSTLMLDVKPRDWV